MQKHLERLRNKILDISLRNPQINFKPTKTSSVFIIKPEFESLYDKLIKDEKHLDFNASTEKIYSANVEKGLMYQFGELVTDKRDIEIVTTLNRLRNRTKQAVEEIGLHPLFMVFGFLNWLEPTTKKMIKSPLVMVPIQISKKNPKRFHISYTKDDIILNPTLQHKLQIEGVSIASYDLFDHDGFSLTSFLERLSKQKELREIKGSITNEVHIGMFSSSSLFMYKDLLENENNIIQNEILNKLYGSVDPETSFLEPEFVDPKYIDENLDLSKTFTVLESDSSQQVAILAAKQNMSFVLQGPPGTGKSQTITNIISDAIANDKKVLFVAEKKAALDVVYEKLKAAQLEDFILDLHSYGAKKDLVIHNLVNTIQNNKEIATKHLPLILEELVDKKVAVDDYLKALTFDHEVIDQSIYDLYGEILNLNAYPLLNFRFQDIFTINQRQLKMITDEFQIYLDYQNTIDYPKVSKAFHGFQLTNISQPEAFKTNFRQLSNKIIEALEDMTKFIARVNIELKIELPITINTILILDVIIKAKGSTPKFLNLSNYTQAIADLKAIIKVRENLVKLSPSHDVPLSNLIELDVNNIYQELKNNYSKRLQRFGRNYQDLRDEINQQIKIEKLNYNELLELLEKLMMMKKVYEPIEQNVTSFKAVDKSFKIDDANQDLLFTLESYQTLNQSFKKSELKKLINAINKVDTDIIDDITVKQVYLTQQIMAPVKFLNQVFDNDVFDYKNEPFEKLYIRFNESLIHIDYIDEYNNLSLQLNKLIKLGHNDLIKELKGYENDFWIPMINKKYYSMWLDYIYFRDSNLSSLTKAKIELDIKTFKRRDIEYLSNTHLKIQEHLYQKFPHQNDINIKSLEDEAIKKRGQKSIRQIFEEMPETILQIKPCLLMSPLSVSTFLPSITNMFDLVVFDEASQIIPENAISSIYRGKQLIVVGDHEQLPPSYFFKQVTEEDEDEVGISITDQYESILDITRAHLPSKKLRWHYRSRHESLIRYSNNEIYKDLILFPEAFKSAKSLGVTFEYVSDGYFEDRHNIREAEKIAELVIEHFKNFPKRSLGVVSFSIKQQETIERQINKIRRSHLEYESFFDEDQFEPFFVKNLENVQGDERDTIILSVCYAKDLHGKLAYRFGPINQDVGYRRLNVATTRAKYNTIVVSSLLPEEIKRTEARGVAFLKGYLDYAKNGSEIEQKLLSSKQIEAHLEQDIYSYLTQLGYEVDLYINPFIQLAIKNPQTKKYEIGIQVDGYKGNKNYTLRDKFRNANSVLESKEWTLYQIWSFDWFRNNEKSKAHLSKQLLQAFGVHPLVTPHPEVDPKIVQEIIIDSKPVFKIPTPKKVKSQQTLKTIQIEIEDDLLEEVRLYPYYQVTTKDMIPRKSSETSDSYLSRFVREIINLESPIHIKVIFERVASLYGDKFLGKRIESDITQWIITWHIKKEFLFSKSFVYNLETPIMFRIPKEKLDIRLSSEITPQELAMGIQIFLTQHLSSPKDVVLDDLLKNLLIESDEIIINAFAEAIIILEKQKIIEVRNEILFIL